MALEQYAVQLTPEERETEPADSQRQKFGAPSPERAPC